MREIFLKTVFVLALLYPLNMAIGQVLPSPSVSPSAIVNPLPSPSPTASAVTTVPVQVAAAPPVWLQTLVTTAESLPLIGPIVVTVLKYLGIIVSIMTAFCAFLMLALQTIGSIASIASLTTLAAKIQAFQSGQIMYWLKYVSAFNAQKSDDTTPPPPAV